MMRRSEQIQEDVNSHFSGNSEHRQQAELVFFFQLLLNYFKSFVTLSLKSKQSTVHGSSSSSSHSVIFIRCHTSARVTALVLIFKSRVIWPSSHGRPDTNRQSDANVASSQNVISDTPLVP